MKQTFKVKDSDSIYFETFALNEIYDYLIKRRQSIIMPANIPHVVKAKKKLKMIFTMIK